MVYGLQFRVYGLKVSLQLGCGKYFALLPPKVTKKRFCWKWTENCEIMEKSPAPYAGRREKISRMRAMSNFGARS